MRPARDALNLKTTKLDAAKGRKPKEGAASLSVTRLREEIRRKLRASRTEASEQSGRGSLSARDCRELRQAGRQVSRWPVACAQQLALAERRAYAAAAATVSLFVARLIRSAAAAACLRPRRADSANFLEATLATRKLRCEAPPANISPEDPCNCLFVCRRCRRRRSIEPCHWP